PLGGLRVGYHGGVPPPRRRVRPHQRQRTQPPGHQAGPQLPDQGRRRRRLPGHPGGFTMTAALTLRDLRASVGSIEILKGLDLDVPSGEVHAIMGPNGSGKSTLCHVLTGREDYEVSGTAELGGVDLLDKDVAERAALGLVQAFQYPVTVPGIRLGDFMREAAAVRGFDDVDTRIAEEARRFGVEAFLDRSINHDLSG